MARTSPDLLQGTLDLLILKTLSMEPMHGWAISQRLRQISGDVFSVNQGSLYPALYRLEHKGYLEAQEGVAENHRTVKLYRLTTLGREQLSTERENWDRLASAMSRVLEA